MVRAFVMLGFSSEIYAPGKRSGVDRMDAGNWNENHAPEGTWNQPRKFSVHRAVSCSDAVSMRLLPNSSED